ncbi:copper chaperone PCu(A)C [Sphingomonas lacunae]|uniref:Copper chaperone PCu(A)C n=1 Tax=Sphingomonas lacunae TaxID=2698828 RepID=A0A6M4AWX7_9SPHN|nr:copper chaperone PCu(A)C [Sphingomonas lacunae]QJQ33266.1 copper chaperone PCu(A)C [Sphingomonas lacunae]
MTVRHRTFRPAIALAALSALMVAGCGGQAEKAAEESAAAEAPAATGELAVKDARLRLNPNASAPSAAYFVLTGGASDDSLVSASSPDAARTEMHESKMEGGMMTMAAISSVPVAAGGTVEFRQGGKHIMLYEISEAARTAGKIKLVLTFASGATLEAEAVVAPDSEEAGEHDDGGAAEHEGH